MTTGDRSLGMMVGAISTTLTEVERASPWEAGDIPWTV